MRDGQELTAGTQGVAFLLVERFSLIAFASAVEPLRLANLVTGRPLFRWSVLSETGGGVNSSTGIATMTEPLRETERDEMVMLVSGMDVKSAATRGLLNWLRREARKGIPVGALCTGAHLLARAGLLDGRRATIHWENRDAFAEEFDEVELQSSIYIIDGNRLTAAGGTSPTDLMLALIGQRHGVDLAGRIADLMIHTQIRSDRDEQRLSIPTRIGVRHPKLATVIRRMEEQIEEPVSPAVLAAEVGLSTRQLERLFRRYVNRSPKRYYMELRLQKARNLLLQTEMSVINVALACGFTSPSHFSKCYRANYGTTPYRERGAKGA